MIKTIPQVEDRIDRDETKSSTYKTLCSERQFVYMHTCIVLEKDRAFIKNSGCILMVIYANINIDSIFQNMKIQMKLFGTSYKRAKGFKDEFKTMT